jgi:hypothetical protein
MKRLFLSMLVALTALAMVLPVSAEVVYNEIYPINMVVWVECANGGLGEEVYFTGELHELYAVTEDGSGGYHIKWHYQPQGLTGEGQTTGDKYQATGVTQGQDNVAADMFPYESTYVNNFRIIGQGKGNNYLVHENIHVTINANGEVTSEHDNWNVDCK